MNNKTDHNLTQNIKKDASWLEEMAIIQLRKAAEQKAGRQMRTPKDFDFLHDSIYEQCHEMVSASTLKRIWGYNKYEGKPRTSSLDAIARYVGNADWNDFIQVNSSSADEDNRQSSPSAKRRNMINLAAFALFFLLVAGWEFLWGCHHSSDKDADVGLISDEALKPSGQRILRKGQDFFSSTGDYLSLFSIADGDTAYFQRLPGHEQVYVWGPEYQNPVWHNEGDSALLMPTITEYWIPLPGTKKFYSQEYVKLANEKLYYERMDKDELRITFMKDIKKGFYVFLGIYSILSF